MTKYTLRLMGVSLCVAACTAFAQAPQKIGVMSLQGAVVGTKDGQKASQQIDQKFGPKQKDFQARQGEIAQLEDQLNKGGNLMSDDKRSQLSRDIDDKKRRLQRDGQDAQEELNRDRQTLLNGIYQRMIAVLQKYARDNNFTLILDEGNQETSPVIFASNTIDITQEIIALYDKTSSGGAPAAVPGAPSPTAPPSK